MTQMNPTNTANTANTIKKTTFHDLRDKELYLTYSWQLSPYINHGICGHTFEVIDYFWLLKDYYSVGIFIGDTSITEDMFLTAIKAKYNFNEDEINLILSNTIFVKTKAKLIRANSIIFTDGEFKTLQQFAILAKNIIMFACGDKDIKTSSKPSTWILQDDRVYEPVLVNGAPSQYSINYIKKILFSKLKKIDVGSKEQVGQSLLYLTKNCRALTDADLMPLLTRPGENFLVISNSEASGNPESKALANVTYLVPPIEDIFSRFNKYIYTPVARQWDCSPRFIAECHHYNIQVEYFNIDYLDIDLGLKYRKLDIETNFSSLDLNHNDDIITILKDIIKV